MKDKGARQKVSMSRAYLSFVVGLDTLLAIALLAGCNLQPGILRRAASDYYPLPAGAQWSYSHPDGTSSLVQVRGESIAYNRPCVVVERDYREEYVARSQGQVRRFVSHVLNIGGTGFPLEQRYQLCYLLPPVSGNSWSELFTDSVDVLGTVFAISHEIRGKVKTDTVLRVWAGQFDDCYELELTETLVLGSSGAQETTRVLTREWFAPGVGIVKRMQDTL
ncbi:MAG: hypothetical protein ABIK62_07185, partial [candidate division WOR-3 bacterium]